MAVAIAFGSQGSAISSSQVATIAGMTFNAAAADRIIAAAVTTQENATITGVTIGGIAATVRASAIETAGVPDILCDIWAAAVPTGTTGDVVVTISANDEVIAVSTFSITGADPTPTDSDTAIGTGADISITALTIPSDGAGIAAFCNNTTTAVTWAGASESSDAAIAGTQHRHSAAIITTVGTNTITADGATSAQALVGVAWGPAAGGSPTSLVIPPEPLPPAIFAAQQWHPQSMPQQMLFSNTPAAPPAASLIYRPTFFDHMIVR